MEKKVVVPRDVMLDMLKAYYKMEQAISSMEIMMDAETTKNIEKSKKDFKKGNFIECTVDEIDSILK